MLCLVSIMMSRRQKKQQWSKGGVERAQEFKIWNSLRIWKMWGSHVYPPKNCAGQTYTSFLVHTTFSCGVPCVLLYLTICKLPASWHKAWPYQIGARVHFPSLSPHLNSWLLTIFHSGWKNTLRLKLRHTVVLCTRNDKKRDYIRTNTIAKLVKSSWVQVAFKLGYLLRQN